MANELWKLHGGNGVLNWLEAEMLVREIFADPKPSRMTSRMEEGERGPHQAQAAANYPHSTAALCRDDRGESR